RSAAAWPGGAARCPLGSASDGRRTPAAGRLKIKEHAGGAPHAKCRPCKAFAMGTRAPAALRVFACGTATSHNRRSTLHRQVRLHFGEGRGRRGVGGQVLELVRVVVVVVELDRLVGPLGVAPALAADAARELALAGGADLADRAGGGLGWGLRSLGWGWQG